MMSIASKQHSEAPNAAVAHAGAAKYWEQRKDSIYLHAAQLICRKFAASANSVIDVGSNGTPTLEWHRPTARTLVSLDLRRPYVAEGVVSLAGDFLKRRFDEKFDLATCFQVLEHVPNATAFAQKLLEVGSTVVVSVPYKWKAGTTKGHVHDPVDEDKMLGWFGKAPVYSYIAHELNGRIRLIHVYRAASQ
jgi:2-polyprenyl-3-methyl-5-hydroxy-6-metoxy-1,4-benzoquinol methylase